MFKTADLNFKLITSYRQGSQVFEDSFHNFSIISFPTKCQGMVELRPLPCVPRSTMLQITDFTAVEFYRTAV